MGENYAIKKVHGYFMASGGDASCSFSAVHANGFCDAVLKVMKTVNNNSYFKDLRIDIEKRNQPWYG